MQWWTQANGFEAVLQLVTMPAELIKARAASLDIWPLATNGALLLSPASKSVTWLPRLFQDYSKTFA
jgi:hypothetical protein